VTICVLDASVALSFSFEDEASPYAEGVIDLLGNQSAIVPVVWPFEVSNAIISAVRRRRIDEVGATRILDTLYQLPLAVDQTVVMGALGFHMGLLGVTYGLSAYDASYLELAIRLDLPLATEDERLAQAVRLAGVAILQL
jgi:predicted nucleic acid-binding protein